MSRVAGACAAALLALTAVSVVVLTGHAPAGHTAAAGLAGRAAPASAGLAAARLGAGTTAAVAPGYPDIPVPLPGQRAMPPAAGRAGSGPAVANITSVGSLNWSGYAVSRHKTTFTAIKTTFFVPFLNCKDSPGSTRSSFWVGLDGYVDHPDSVEQIGIGADCSSARKASYFSWFEMFPFAQTKLPLKVHAGDSVTTSVSWVAATKDFRLVLADNTRGGSATRVRKCPAIKISGKAVRCPRTSAEIIAEAPASGTSSHLTIDHLSDYGAVSFASVSITDGAGQHAGIVSSHWSATKITQLRGSGGPTLAEPTSVHADAFDSYWLRED